MRLRLPRKITKEFANYVDCCVRSGFMDRHEIIDRVRENYADDPNFDPAMIARHIDRIIDRSIARLQRRQRRWPAETDCDRLDAAFEELNASGLIARHHYSCCQNCGVYEIELELDDAVRCGAPARAFTFYHEQDTESAVEGYGIMLTYGAAEGDEAEHVAAGHEITSTLRAHGLRVEWDGDLSKRIAVPMDWKRRWPPRKSDAISAAVIDRVHAWRQSQGNGVS